VSPARDTAGNTESTELPIHDAQILTYLKLLRVRVGLLVNFNVRRLMDGVHRFVL